MATTSEETTEHVKAIASFKDMGIELALLVGINQLGFQGPSVVQQRAFTHIIEGRDVVVQAQPGAGKTSMIALTVCHLVNTCMRQVQALILSPTRELALQTENVILALGKFLKIQAHCCIGGRSMEEDIRKLENGGIHVVSGTPGRVLNLIKKRRQLTKAIKILFLDESHEMFCKDQIYELYGYLPSNIQVVLMSISLPLKIQKMTEDLMTNPVSILVKEEEELTLEGLKQFQIVVGDEGDKFDTLDELYGILIITTAVIFCNTKDKVEWLTQKMLENKHGVSSMHGDMSQEEREANMREFRAGTTRVLITSDVWAFRLHLQKVGLVINYDFPDTRELYIHRIGCCGYFYPKRLAISFVRKDEVAERMVLEDIEEYYSTHIDEMPANVDDII